MAGQKLTLEQQERAVEVCAQLLARCLHTSQIKAAFRREFGPVSAPTVMRYVSRARALLRERYAAGQKDAGPDVREMLVSMLRDPDVKPNQRLRALDLLMDLHGLKTQRVEVAGPGGGPIEQRVGVTSEEVWRRYQEVLRDAAPASSPGRNGNGAHA